MRRLISFDIDRHPRPRSGCKRSVSIPGGVRPAALYLIPAEELSEIFDETEKDNDRRPGDADQERGFETVHEECKKVDHDLKSRSARDKDFISSS
jgi:hypothetical protein